MNILFIGNYRSPCGWGQGCHDFARMLLTTGHNIVTRPIYMSGGINPNIHPDVVECEQKKCKNYDVVIQRVLPHLLEFSNNKAKHICFCSFETGNLENTGWPRYINMVDELWVASEQESKDLSESGVNIPIHITSESADVSKYDKKYERGQFAQLEESFNFYFIGEYIPRKNLRALLHAFHCEFRPSENVELLIKTNGNQEMLQQLEQEINNVKSVLRLYRNIQDYKHEMLITDFLSEDEMCALHQACDCFVMPSRGEAYCRPVVDAMGFGNTPIVTDNTGMTSFVSNTEGWVVNSHRTPVFSPQFPLPHIYTGLEVWSEIDVLELRKHMREAFELNTLQRLQKKSKGIERVKQYSYENIGKKINELIGE